MPVTIDGSNTPTAGGVGYGDGTELAFTSAGSAGQVLLSNGASAPSFGALPTVNLATGVTGTLPVGNGGTGATTLTANNVLLGNGTSAVQVVAPGSSGNVLTSNGTTWTSGAAPGFPAGTVMLFVQTAAPTGWTKSTTHNNKALRVVSGSAGSGGSVAFTTAFASQSASGTVGSTTLTTAQMPSHRHFVTNSGSTFQFGSYAATGNNNGNGWYTDFEGGGGSHNHTFTGSTIDLAVQYVDVILATKD
jgi:hypothetical protein